MEFPDKESLRIRFEKYSDEQLMEVLKNKKDYQELAVSVAIELAVERGLIKSEQDLFGGEFNKQKSGTPAIFPALEQPGQREKVFKSLMRVVYFITLFPVIYAALSYADGKTGQVFFYGTTAVIWAAMAVLLDQKRKVVYCYGLFVFFILIIAYHLYSILPVFKPSLIDWVIWGISTLLVFYVIGYAHALIKRSQGH